MEIDGNEWKNRKLIVMVYCGYLFLNMACSVLCTSQSKQTQPTKKSEKSGRLFCSNVVKVWKSVTAFNEND